MSGWIKIHRQILDWEWYSDNNAFRVFMHLILKANHKDKRFKGIELKAGSVVTSRDILAIETGLSVRQIRTALDKLKTTNEVTIKTSSKGTIIQVVNYEKYQIATSETTNERPANDQQTTSNKNIKKEKKYIYSFYDSLIENGFDEQLAKDWMKVRKEKNAVNTQTAFKQFLSEVEKHGGNKNEILKTCVERSWKGFKANWIEKENDTLLATLKNSSCY